MKRDFLFWTCIYLPKDRYCLCSPQDLPLPCNIGDETWGFFCLNLTTRIQLVTIYIRHDLIDDCAQNEKIDGTYIRFE